jgi:uncharacterized protein (TIGR02246 family)
MRRTWILVGLFVGLPALIFPPVQGRPAPKKQAPKDTRKGKEQAGAKLAEDRTADEAAIRANVATFVRAYNVGDAKVVAVLFTPDALIVDKDANTWQGRAAIEQTFAKLFAAAPRQRLEVFVEEIRFIGPDLAVEVGATKETPASGEEPTYDRYTVLHVKRDGAWQMALVRDAEGPAPTNHERLQPLAWLVGEWVEDGGSAVVVSKCRWSNDGNFLLHDYELRIDGRDALEVQQRIGWDPLARRIRSWVFDSEGGYGESVWTRHGDAWVIKATGVRPDGTTASSTNVLVPTGKDGYVWRSTDRVVGDRVDSQIEVKVVRKPPQPNP